ITTPYIRLPSSPNQRINLAQTPISPKASAYGLPCSSLIICANSSCLFNKLTAYCSKYYCLVSAVYLDHFSKEETAELSASWTVSLETLGTSPMLLLLAGLNT